MRILTVVVDLGSAGTQRAAQCYALAYARRGRGSAVLTYRGGGPRQADVAAGGIPVFVGGPGAAELERAVACALEWGPDVVHIHRTGHPDDATMSVLKALRARSGRRLPIIETNVFARVDDSPDRDVIDLHLLLSRWCLWKWSRWAAGLSPPLVGAVAPYMADASAFRPITESERRAFREAHGIPAEAFVLGRVGSPNMGKWSPIAFDAFRRAAEADSRLRLLAVGLPPELRRAIASMPPAVRRRITDIPFIHGDAALRACYGSTDVFLHAAKIGESFGMVLCEAMLCEVPVITLSTPAKDNSQLEVVGHEEGGVVVTGAASMARAIGLLASDDALRRGMGVRARRRVVERFTEEPVASTLLALIDALAADPTREALRARLRSDGRFITGVADAEIHSLLARTLGRTPVRERLLMRAVANPFVYKQYTRLKAKGLRRWRRPTRG